VIGDAAQEVVGDIPRDEEAHPFFGGFWVRRIGVDDEVIGVILGRANRTTGEAEDTDFVHQIGRV